MSARFVHRYRTPPRFHSLVGDMHTVSMQVRQRARWRWIAIAVAILLVQGIVAVMVRSETPSVHDDSERQPRVLRPVALEPPELRLFRAVSMGAVSSTSGPLSNAPRFTEVIATSLRMRSASPSSFSVC